MTSKDNHKSKTKSPDPSPKPTKKPKRIEAKAPAAPTNREKSLTAVGIGASAGGLEALSAFFEALPAQTDMAFVVVMHLHPEHESHLAELLQRYTQMPVMQVRKRTKVEASHVYVIPPNRAIIVTNTHLDIHEFEEPHGWRMPIDHFALFNANPIPTALIRLEDYVFLNVNAEFLSYFGLQRETVVNRTAEDFHLGLDMPAYRRLIDQVKRDGRVHDYETQVIHPSGEKRSILASVQYTDLDGIEAVIATFIDITDRVHAEQQVRSLVSELTAAEQAERHRISQILHDDLQQRIFAIQMQLSFLREAYEKNDLQSFALDFPQLEGWLAEAIQVTRQLSVDLSPPILHGEGLVEAVIWLGSQMEEQYGLTTRIMVNGTPVKIEEKVQVLVFYAIRELLFNVVKHSGTSEADIRFEYDPSRLRVIVKDQGGGFNSAQVMGNPKIAHGLLIIRHRLSLLGCSMEIQSHPGKGTEAIIEAPYEEYKEMDA